MSLIMSLVIQTTTMTTRDSSRMNVTLSTMIQPATLSSLTTSQNQLLIRCDQVPMAHTLITTAVNSTIMSVVNLSLSITNSTTMRQRLTFTTHTLFTRLLCPVNGSCIERREMTRTMRTTMRKISIIVMDTPMVQLLHKSSNRPKRRTNQLRKSKFRSSSINLKLLISSNNLSKEVHWTSCKV